MSQIDLPAKFPYNPKYKATIFAIVFFSFCSWGLADQAMHNDRGLVIDLVINLDRGGATIFYWALFGFCLVAVLLAFFMILRRMANPQELVVNEDSIVVPQGFLKKTPVRMHYSEIQSATQTTVSKQIMFNLKSRDRKVTILESWLPNKETYVIVRDFVLSHMPRS